MREQNIEVIRKACVAANPEIEPRIFTLTDADFRTFEGKMFRVPSGVEFFLTELCKTKKAVERVELRYPAQADRVIEIHEYRPIRLADVLEAARKVGYNSTEDWLAVITGIVTRYNLRNDLLTDQSDEYLAFLANLLK